MREIIISEECLSFIDNQNERVTKKFFQIISVIEEIKIVDTNFVKKIQNSDFYELRIKAENEYRIIIFSIDHENFLQCTQAICLNGFVKKSKKDYKKAIKEAEKLLEEFFKRK